MKSHAQMTKENSPTEVGPHQWRSGSAVKAGRREVSGSIPVELVDLAVRSFQWFSPKLA